MFAAHNLLSDDPRGLLLLRLLRSHLELDMYASLTVHTEETMGAGRKELLVFGDLLDVSFLSYIISS
jgi:hypothetical protein